MSALRDALATAAGEAFIAFAHHNAEGRCPSCLKAADDILADPAFRAALTESIAEALAGLSEWPPGQMYPNFYDSEGDAIVARMLGEKE